MLGLLLSTLLPFTAAPDAPTVDEPVAQPASDDEFRLPQLVRGSSAFRLRAPISLALVNYRPLARFDMGLLRAIKGPHWLTFTGAILFDHPPALRTGGDANCDEDCSRHWVAGLEFGVGYRFTPRFHRKPWLVPELHGALVGGGWDYTLMEMSWRHTFNLGVQAGGGLRIFLTSKVGVGFDVDLQADILAHKTGVGVEPQFGLGLALLPAVLEIRR